MKYVYEFTNKRKLTKSEFIKWFQKKFLYTIRRFNMIKKGDIIGFSKKSDFRNVVLKDLLKMLSMRMPVEIIKLPNKKITKKAVAETNDIISYKLIKEIINKKIKSSKEFYQFYPVDGKKIKPLYFFLDKEVELYAKLKNLKYKKIKEKKDKIIEFINELEKKHPELKHSIIQAYLRTQI